jgi:AcrR family transcriptional regulator
MGLFATMPVEEVTVQDIATAVAMTPAAVYYHFASKEQILVEGMQRFAQELTEQLRDRVAALTGTVDVATLVADLVSWTARHKVPATVYFVNSIGLNLMVEALRRETRYEMIDVLRTAVRANRKNRAEAGVIAVGLVSLIETALASMLNQDATYHGLGGRRFASEVAALAARIAGT